MVDVARPRRIRHEVPAGTAWPRDRAQGALDRVKRFARDRPVSFGLSAFGVGFLVGWKLKPR